MLPWVTLGKYTRVIFRERRRIGGIAVIARGVRRMTTDIDAAVRGDQVDVATFLDALAKKRIVPRINDVERFARFPGGGKSRSKQFR